MFTFFLGILSYQAQAGTSNDTWEVLAIQEDTKLIAYKSTFYENSDEVAAPVDCEYPDVSAGEGVTLGIWSIDQGKTIQTWNIYSSVFNKENCIPLSKAKENLTSAKKAFAKKNLDLSKKPTSVLIKKSLNSSKIQDTIPYSIDGTFEIFHQHGGAKYTFDVLVFDDRPTETEDGYLLKRSIRDIHNRIVYDVEKEGSRIMASSLDIQFPKAYVIGNQVVFLQSEYFNSMRYHSLTLSFTPLIDIK